MTAGMVTAVMAAFLPNRQQSARRAAGEMVVERVTATATAKAMAMAMATATATLEQRQGWRRQ
jgi:hypothetical protein